MSLTVEKYLAAWNNHDTKLIRELFDASAVYKMAGKQPLQGIEAICRYWERNKKRQYNLKIFPPLKLSDAPNSSSFVFCATFADTEEREDQTVYGHITLQHRDGRIFDLAESYLLERRKFVETNTGALLSAVNPVAGFFRQA